MGENTIYIWMEKRANQFLDAMRNPMKRTSLSSTSNPIKVVDGGKRKLDRVKIHVDDDGDEREDQYTPSESEPQ